MLQLLCFLEINHIVDVDVYFLLVSADGWQKKCGQEFRVQVSAYDLGPLYFHGLGTVFKEDYHRMDLLESLGSW